MMMITIFVIIKFVIINAYNTYYAYINAYNTIIKKLLVLLWGGGTVLI